jgi:hypothetical protein
MWKRWIIFGFLIERHCTPRVCFAPVVVLMGSAQRSYIRPNFPLVSPNLSRVRAIQATAQLVCKVLDVGFFDDGEVAAGDFVDIDAAAGKSAQAFNEV